MIFTNAPTISLGASASPIKTVQRMLSNMGLPVRASGVLDQATVDAINGVFGEWSDVPPKLRTGQLTKGQVAANIRDVQRYVKMAATGAMNVEAGSY